MIFWNYLYYLLFQKIDEYIILLDNEIMDDFFIK
jgi:hypothetical protein